MKRMLRIKDIAERASVSPSTVSRVLQRSGSVSKPTREAVERVIRETGYTVNVTARRLRSGKTSVIGHIHRSATVNTLFTHILAGIEGAAHQADYSVISTTINDDPKEEVRAAELLISHRVEGAIFTAVLSEESVKMLCREGIPVVLNERYYDLEGVDRVVVDNYSAAFEATMHLANLGHEHIAYLSGPIPSIEQLARVEKERCRGYREALHHADPERFHPVIAEAEVYDVPTGRKAGERLLNRIPRPTALFVGSDQLALGVFQAAHSMGLRVPEDLSLIGFDDAVAEFGVKQLTTVRQPMYEMGQTATRLIVERLQGVYSGDTRTVMFKPKLIVRETTAQATAADR